MTLICHLILFVIRMHFPIIIMIVIMIVIMIIIMNMIIISIMILIKEFLVEAEIQAPPSHCHWSAAHTAVQVE